MKKNAYKKCSKCEKILPATKEYFHRGNGSYGLYHWCKGCKSTYSKSANAKTRHTKKKVAESTGGGGRKEKTPKHTGRDFQLGMWLYMIDQFDRVKKYELLAFAVSRGLEGDTLYMLEMVDVADRVILSGVRSEDVFFSEGDALTHLKGGLEVERSKVSASIAKIQTRLDEIVVA